MDDLRLSVRTRVKEHIVSAGPKHWNLIVKKDIALLTDIQTLTHHLGEDNTFAERVYVAISGIDPVCERGGRKKLKSIENGWAFCGRANQCECAKESVSHNSRKSHLAKTEIDIEKAKQKRAKTNIEKYGVANTGLTEKAYAGREKYLSDPDKLAQGVKKNRASIMRKHGVTGSANIPHVRQKLIEGIRTPVYRSKVAARNKNQIEKFREAGYNKVCNRLAQMSGFVFKTPLADYKGIGNHQYYTFQCTSCNLDFQDYLFANNDPACPRCTPKPIPNYVSKEENEVADFISSLGISVIRSTQKTVRGVELDIFLPDFGIAVEYDGLYWHSEKSNGKHKMFHIDKRDLVEAAGYRLINIFSDEWNLQKSIVKERLRHILQNSQRVYARQCSIGHVNAPEADLFLNMHHIQGKGAPASVRLGLYENDTLVALMTFGKERKHNNPGSSDWELYRFVSSKAVVGGASRLFKRFVKDHSPKRVVSFCDRRWGTGKLYEQLGFTLDHKTVPGYFWVEKYQRRVKRSATTLKELAKQGFDTINNSETEIMFERGFDRIWDCGHLKFVWVK